MEGGFLWLMTVGGQAGEEMNEEVERAAMAAVLDLADVFELVVNAAVRGDSKDLVLGDAGVLADAEAGRVDETDPVQWLSWVCR